MRLHVEQIAQAIYEVNRTFRIHLGDADTLPWEQASLEERMGAVTVVKYFIAHPDGDPGSGDFEWGRWFPLPNELSPDHEFKNHVIRNMITTLRGLIFEERPGEGEDHGTVGGG